MSKLSQKLSEEFQQLIDKYSTLSVEDVIKNKTYEITVKRLIIEAVEEIDEEPDDYLINKLMSADNALELIYSKYCYDSLSKSNIHLIDTMKNWIVSEYQYG